MTIAIEIGKFTVAMATLYVKYYKIEKILQRSLIISLIPTYDVSKSISTISLKQKSHEKITSYLDQTNVISAKISHLYLNIEELRAWKKG